MSRFGPNTGMDIKKMVEASVKEIMKTEIANLQKQIDELKEKVKELESK